MLTNETVEDIARNVGFTLIGFARADLLEKEADHLEKWITDGYQAGMKYMERNIEKRKDVSLILPGAKSVISLALNYNTNHKHTQEKGKGKVSRYAWGKDYHLIIWQMLEQLEIELKKVDPGFKCKSYVDTGPVMDKVWALKAGIGWMGKHSNIINRSYGSWFFIANIITNQVFKYSEKISDFCGSCTACIDACPTNAIIEDCVVDSNKCISYLTIENKDAIPDGFRDKFDGWIFGCDICQDVCPWNISFSQMSSLEEFNPQTDNKEISLDEVSIMKNADFKKRFADSPVSRAKLKGLKRNAKFLHD
jgi:epoxyqueuosine reductase